MIRFIVERYLIRKMKQTLEIKYLKYTLKIFEKVMRFKFFTKYKHFIKQRFLET